MVDIEKIKKRKNVQELLEFGIINIDKPSGPTSFDVSDFVRGVLGLRKTSHFGTLDPKVTGVLPIALNRACKLTGFFLGEDKEYVGLMRIHEPVAQDKLKEAVKKFTGKIMQLPPVKSRVARVEREREIKRFEILETELDNQNVLFKAEVQGGTYIRKLVHDLGESLGIGAHMIELRRTRAGIFKEERSHTLYELEDAVRGYKEGNEEKLREMIMPGEIVSQLFPVVNVKEEIVNRLLHGSPLFSNEINIKDKFNPEDKICIFAGDKFIGVFKVVLEDKMFAKPEFVLQPIK